MAVRSAVVALQREGRQWEPQWGAAVRARCCTQNRCGISKTGIVGDFFWDGNRPPWGCLWFSMWRHNVLALHECSQQAVVIQQVAPDAPGVWAYN